jgi:hypothetical protein
VHTIGPRGGIPRRVSRVSSSCTRGKKKSIAVLAASLRPLRHRLGRKGKRNDWMTAATWLGRDNSLLSSPSSTSVFAVGEPYDDGVAEV